MAGPGVTPLIEPVRRELPNTRRVIPNAAKPSTNGRSAERPELRPESPAEANLRRFQRAETLREIDAMDAARRARVDISPAVSGVPSSVAARSSDRIDGTSHAIARTFGGRDVTPLALVAADSGRVFAILPKREVAVITERDLRLGRITTLATGSSGDVPSRTDQPGARSTLFASLLLAGTTLGTTTKSGIAKREQSPEEQLLGGIMEADTQTAASLHSIAERRMRARAEQEEAVTNRVNAAVAYAQALLNEQAVLLAA